MSFLYPTLAALGAALAVAPIVIHLIHLRRRRRVAWAAMDFLLHSSQKNRTWVRLSEWLLLASRVVAVALAGLLAATPRAADLLDGFFGADSACHLVLLDDTASMGRRSGGTDAWTEATEAIRRLTEAAERSGDRVVVARYTDRLTGREPATLAAGRAANPDAWRATLATATPRDGLLALLDLEATTDAARTYAYVFSDFAEASHRESAGWSEPLGRLSRSVQEVVLAACGEPSTGNLAISSFELAPGPSAAGVETRLLIEVVNHAESEASPVTIALSRGGESLASVEVGPIDPGGRRRVETPFTPLGVGLHVVTATLPPDGLEADDRRWLPVEAPASWPVLLVDNSEERIESRVYAAALRPLGSARSGWSPQRTASPTPEELAGAAAVLVLDVDRLGPSALSATRRYAEQRGGLFWSFGPRTDVEWFNRSAVEGLEDPVFPWRIGPPISGPVVAAGEPAISVTPCHVLRSLAGERSNFLPLIRTRVRRRLATDDEAPRISRVTLSDDDPATDTLAAFVDGGPLLLASRRSRVLALLTASATAGPGEPAWSNLASLPIFPVLVNDLVGWLAHERLAAPVEAIGAGSTKTSTQPTQLQRWISPEAFEPAAGLGPAAPLDPAEPGVYRRAIGGDHGPVFAVSIASEESDLRSPGVVALRERWGSTARVGRAEDLFRDTPNPTSRGPLYAIAATLLAVCVVERWLALQNSYLQADAVARRARETA